MPDDTDGIVEVARTQYRRAFRKANRFFRERSRQRKAWAERESHGAASDVRVIDPVNGEVVELIDES